MNYKSELGGILTHNLDKHMLSLITAEAPVSSEGPSSFIVFYSNNEQGFFEGLGYADANRSKDAIVWAVYPKQTSKSYRSTINRDDILRLAQTKGYTPVRQIAVDDDLSALRLKRI